MSRSLPKSIREYIELIKAHDGLSTVEVPVSAELEIAEITDRVSKATADQNKALLFNQVEGSTMPLAINLFGSDERMKLALGVEHYEEIQQRIQQFIKPPVPGSFIDKLKMLPMLADLNKFLPKTTSGDGACQEVVITDPSQPMLDALPILTCWPDDGGPFITLPVVFTKDPETGRAQCRDVSLAKI